MVRYSPWQYSTVLFLPPRLCQSNRGYDSDTVQDAILGSVCSFRGALSASPVEWLTDNGSTYRAHETRAYAREIGLEPTEQRCSGELRKDDEARLYIEKIPKPDCRTAVGNLAIAFDHYNEHHTHSSLRYRSSREYLRCRVPQP